MSSVDPGWPPPKPPRQQPHPVAYAFAVVMPLVLLAAIAAPLGLVWGLDRLRSGQPQPPLVRPLATDGDRGVGDPYYPDAGNGGYQVSKYVIDLNWDVATESITSTTTIYARASEMMRSFYLDLALRTERVVVDGRPADFDRAGFSDLQIIPANPIAAGADFQVQVEYSG